MVIHNLQKYDTMEDATRSMPRIYAALDHQQAEHQSHMIEFEGMIHKLSISILINSGASHSYRDPKLVEKLHLERYKHERSWTVQLAT